MRVGDSVQGGTSHGLAATPVQEPVLPSRMQVREGWRADGAVRINPDLQTQGRADTEAGSTLVRPDGPDLRK